MKRGLCKDVKSGIPMCQKRKYKNTNTQIHNYTNTQIQHMMNCQKDPAGAILSKIGLFKNIKNYIPVCQTHKYKNTKIQIHKYSI